LFLDIVEYVRKYKTEKQISMWADIEKLIIKWSKDYIEIIKKYTDDLIGVTKVKNIEWIENNEIWYEIV
jgi:valyl-tRNA synthetase